MKVKFLDLQVQYHQIKDELEKTWQPMLENTAFVGGAAVKTFEEDFAAYCGAKFAIGVANGTEAIEISLRAAGVGPGDEVIIPANTFIATAEAVSATGATPVLVDNARDTYSIDVSKIEAAITPKTKVIMPVHLYGQPAALDEIHDIAEKHGVAVIEDAAQAHGAFYKGKRIGSGKSKAAAFSFYPGKNLGAFGDGGAIVTDDEGLATMARMIANHGGIKKYQHDVVGRNSRLDALQAAVLTLKLKRLDDWNEKRRKNAKLYGELLKDVEGVSAPVELAETLPVYHLYVVRVANREAVQAKLGEMGVASGIHYPTPIHEMKAYKCLGHKPSDFPVASEYAPQILSLPMYAELTEAEIRYVVDCLKQCI